MGITNWDSTILKSADPLVGFYRTIGVVGRYVLITVLQEDLEMSNDLMSAAEELMMLNRLLIVPGVVRAMLIIGVNLLFLVLRPYWSIVLQRNGIINAPGMV